MSAVVESYATIIDLRAAHSVLLKRLRDGNSAASMRDDVESFILSARATGALLDADAHRDAAQGLIDYWSTTLVRNSIAVPETTLVDFNPLLAPTLAEELCPYLGLEAFREKDSKRFFGRARMLQSMLAKLAGTRIVMVFGPSGSGKSSVVLGGLLPMLKEGALEGSASWRYVGPLVPGSDPLANLAACFSAGDREKFLGDPLHLTKLLADGPPVCIVIDQFEEMFTLCENDALRNAFAANLVTLLHTESPRHCAILTMRSDYDQHLAKLPELQKLIENADLRATPLNAAELREAIEKAAEPVGLKFESGLVDKLIGDVLGEPAALPLLQFTLLRLWQERDHNRLTLAAYNRLGGGRVALARSADALYESLIPQDQFTMRRILLRMVRPGAGSSEVTSSRVRRAELMAIGDDPDRVARVLQKLVDARLVRSGANDDPDAQVEVAHEALVRNWPRLVVWLEELRGQMTTRRRFETLADEWERFGRSSGWIAGAQLEEAERWLASEEVAELGVKPVLRAFVKESRVIVDRIDRSQRHLRNARIAAVILLVAIGVGLYVLKQKADQRRAARENAKLTALLLQNQQIQQTLAAYIKSAKEARTLFRRVSPSSSEVIASVLQLGRPRRQRPVEPGAAISGISYGTVCCVVTDVAGGTKRYLLSTALVTGVKESKVVQPPSGEQGSGEIGTVIRTDQDGALISVIELAPGVSATNVVPGRGVMRPRTREPKAGDPVYMLGSVSGLVKGNVVSVSEFIVTTIASEDDDMGAPLLTEDNQLVGVMWQTSGGLSIAVSMTEVETMRGVKLASP